MSPKKKGSSVKNAGDAADEWLATHDTAHAKPKEDRADIAHDDTRDGEEDKALRALIDGAPRLHGETLDRQLRRAVRRGLAKNKIDVSRFTARRRKLLQVPTARMPIGPEPWQARQGGVKRRPKGGRDRAPLVRLIVLLSTVDVLQLHRHLTNFEMALVTMALGFWPTKVSSVRAAVRTRERYVIEHRYRFPDRN